MKISKLLPSLALVTAVIITASCGSEPLPDKNDENADGTEQTEPDEKDAELEEICKKFNSNIAAVQKICRASESHEYLESIEYENNDNGAITWIKLYSGEIIAFEWLDNPRYDSKPRPEVGMRKGEDGNWYWFVNGRQLLKDAQPVKVLSMKIPIVKCRRSDINNDELTWKISCDGGNVWDNVENTQQYDRWGIDMQIYKVHKSGTLGVGFAFGNGADDKENMIIIFPPILKIKTDNRTTIAFNRGGDTHSIHYTLSDVMDKATLEAEVSNGWQVSITPETLTSGTITITAPETIEETTITITAKESDRTAKCELKCGKPKFSLSQTEFSVGHEGGNISVEVETNLNSFVKIPDDAQSWIEWVTEETTDEKIVLRVSENNGAFSRNATIWCLEEDGIVLDKFNVSQSWDQDKIFEVRVSDAGTLHEYMKAHNMLNIRKLKVLGSLSDDDFFFLGGMRSLKYLDASDVDALSLPNGCFINSEYCEMFVLPKTLTAISEKCFYGCKSIKKILIPAFCETIGVSAFECCSRLSSISFESGSCLKTMSYSSFKGCSLLTGISIPASCETIGVSAFERCSSLISISFESGSCLKIMSDSSFRGCSSLTSISIPASCETIDAYAFRGCAITDVTYANGSTLATIGTEAFAGCGNLHRIDMRNCTKLKSIGSKAFYGDNQIYSFQIGVAVPPSCPADAFDNVGEYSVLKVPSGSEGAYKAASGWSEFYKIIANE